MMTSKKTPASIDVEILEKPVVDNSSPAPENQEEKKDGLKDKEELLKEDDDVCEEVKEKEVGDVVLDQPEEKEEVATKVYKDENVSSWKRKKRTTSRLFTSPPPPAKCTLQVAI